MNQVRIDCRNRSTFVTVFTYLSEPSTIMAFPKELTFIVTTSGPKYISDYLQSVGVDMNNVDIYDL